MHPQSVTWCDLGSVPQGAEKRLQVLAVVPMRNRAGCLQSSCHVLLVDGRLLCSAPGRITVFCGREAVERFVGLIDQLEVCYETGSVNMNDSWGEHAHCVALADGVRLGACRHGCSSTASVDSACSAQVTDGTRC